MLKRLLPTSLKETKASPMMTHLPLEEQTNLDHPTWMIFSYLPKAPAKHQLRSLLATLCPRYPVSADAQPRIVVAIEPTVSRDASGIRWDSIPEWMPTKVLEDMARQEVHTTQPKRLTPYVKRKRRISKISSQDKAPTLRMKFPRSMNQPKTPRSVLGEPPLWVGHLPAELEVPLS
jgi:hypothetical protein